jgi:hypothetical protein
LHPQNSSRSRPLDEIAIHSKFLLAGDRAGRCAMRLSRLSSRGRHFACLRKRNEAQPQYDAGPVVVPPRSARPRRRLSRRCFRISTAPFWRLLWWWSPLAPTGVQGGPAVRCQPHLRSGDGRPGRAHTRLGVADRDHDSRGHSPAKIIEAQ